jgi:hypothetical protein
VCQRLKASTPLRDKESGLVRDRDVAFVFGAMEFMSSFWVSSDSLERRPPAQAINGDRDNKGPNRQRVPEPLVGTD